MSFFLKNFLGAVRSHAALTAVNLLGLAAAWMIVLAICMQLRFELGYDRFRSAPECIYRVEQRLPDGPEAFSAVLSRVDAEEIIKASPRILGGALEMNAPEAVKVAYEPEPGRVLTHRHTLCYVNEAFPSVLQLDMTEGTSSLDDPSRLIIPLSAAREMFSGGAAVGRRIEVVSDFSSRTDRQEYYVGGVYRDMPANSQIGNRFYVPMGSTDRESYRKTLRRHVLYLRLDSPRARPEVEAALNGQASGAVAAGEKPSLRLMPLSDVYFFGGEGGVHGCGWRSGLLAGIALLLLGVAAANYGAYALALLPRRMAALHRHRLLGCPPERLRAALLGESALFGAAAYLLALYGLLAIESTSLAKQLPGHWSLGGNLPLLAWGLLGALGTGVLCGWYPARRAVSSCGNGGADGCMFSRKCLRSRLGLGLSLGFQYAVALSLLLSVAAMHLQSRFLKKQDLGFCPQGVLTLSVTASLMAQSEAWVRELERIPIVESVAFSSSDWLRTDPVRLTLTDAQQRPREFRMAEVSPGFVELTGMRLIEGENISAFGTPNDCCQPALANRLARERYGLRVGDRLGRVKIVGFVADFHDVPLCDSLAPYLLLAMPMPAYYPAARAYIRVSGSEDPGGLLGAYVKRTAMQLDLYADDAPCFLDRHIAGFYASQAKEKTLLSLFCGLFVLICLSGVCAQVSLGTAFRRREIAVRRMLGATRRQSAWRAVRPFVQAAGVGMLPGGLLAWVFINGYLGGYALRIAFGWWHFALAGLLLGVLTVLAIGWQIYRRASESVPVLLREP